MKAGLLLCALLVIHAALPVNGTMERLISEVEQHVDQGLWEEAGRTSHELASHFRKILWMLQLLGDEEEYESLERRIGQLKAAIGEKDKTESKLLLSDIRSILQSIYSL